MSKTYTERQLRQMMQLAHQRHVMTEARSDYISLANGEGELLYVNEAYGRRYGREPIELIGCNLLDFVPAEERDVVRLQITAALFTDEMLESVSRVAGASLASGWIAWQNTRVIGPAGEHWLYSVGRELERDVLLPGRGRCFLNIGLAPRRQEGAPDSLI